jgi:hypothetical protein
MTNEDLERARKWLKPQIPVCTVSCDGDLPGEPHEVGCALHGTFGPTQVNWLELIAAYGAKEHAEGEREVFERLLEALDAMVRNRSDITVPKVVYMAIDYLKEAFPEYAKTEEQCPGDSQPSQS